MSWDSTNVVTINVDDVASPTGRLPSPPVIAFCTALASAISIARS